MAKADPRDVFEARLAAGLVCAQHPKYKGLRKPRTDCARCWSIYEYRVSTGAQERRHRERGREGRYSAGLSETGVCDNASTVVSVRVDQTADASSVYGAIVAGLTARNLDEHLDPDSDYAAVRESEGLQ
jgi:hypothetical protein